MQKIIEFECGSDWKSTLHCCKQSNKTTKIKYDGIDFGFNKNSLKYCEWWEEEFYFVKNNNQPTKQNDWLNRSFSGLVFRYLG